MKSSVIKRSIVIDGHKTSVSLENAFGRDLKEIAQTQQSTLSKLVATIDGRRQQGNLSSAIRLFVLEHRRNEYNRKRETKFAEYQLTDTDIQRSHADAP
ncbi:MAG: ribbon-helix-helix domain-containing protein [Pseudolabrys sp.]